VSQKVSDWKKQVYSYQIYDYKYIDKRGGASRNSWREEVSIREEALGIGKRTEG
jgi:hypothetical protein